MNITITPEAKKCLLRLPHRFSFQVEGEEIYILTIGPHDVGLGKK